MASLAKLNEELRELQMRLSDKRIRLIVDWLNIFYRNNTNCYLAIRMDSNPITGEERTAPAPPTRFPEDGGMDAYPIHDMKLSPFEIPTIDERILKNIIMKIADTTAKFYLNGMLSRTFCIFLTCRAPRKYINYIGQFGKVLQRTDMLNLMCFDLPSSLIKRINKGEDETEMYIELFHYLITKLYNYTQRVGLIILNSEGEGKSDSNISFKKKEMLKYKFKFVDL